MKKIISTYLFILIAAFGVVSQTSNRPTAIDLTLRLITLRTKSLKADNDKQISAYNQEFRTEIKAAIEQNLEFEFDSIPSFGHVNSPDKKFEIYTWNILKEFDEYEEPEEEKPIIIKTTAGTFFPKKMLTFLG